MSPAAPRWLAAPADVTLSAGAVHVWRVALSWPPAQLPSLLSLLSPEERERAARFRFPRGYRRFIVSHAALRDILARYLSRAPQSLLFETNAYGKPFLAGDDSWLHFNLSHSGEWALVAVTSLGPVGVDVEQVRDDFSGEAIARRFFSPSEVEAFLALPPELRTQGFFSCWTRKEAFIKAVGMGVSFALDGFAVSLHPDEQPRVLWVRDNPQEADSWSLLDLRPGPGYAAALAIRAKPHQVSLWQWQTPR